MNTKLIIIALALAGTVCAQQFKSDPVTMENLTTLPSSLFSDIETTTTMSLSFSCEGGTISINTRTGDVTIPPKVKISDAAIAFWRAVAKAYPEVRREMLAGGKDEPEWLGMVTYFVPYAGIDPGFYGKNPPETQMIKTNTEIGLRPDGTVVWRKKP